MYVAKLVLATGVAVLLMISIGAAVVFVENRFGCRSPQSLSVTIDEAAVWWKKVLVRWNDHVRYSGIFLSWLGLCAFLNMVRRQPTDSRLVPVAIAGIGVLIYAWGLAWRWFVTVRDGRVS